jgi:hypothetical protein
MEILLTSIICIMVSVPIIIHITESLVKGNQKNDL